MSSVDETAGIPTYEVFSTVTIGNSVDIPQTSTWKSRPKEHTRTLPLGMSDPETTLGGMHWRSK